MSYQPGYAYPQPAPRRAQWGCLSCLIAWILACGGVSVLCVGAFVAFGFYIRSNSPEPPLGESFTPSAADADRVATMVVNTINVAEEGRGEFSLTISQEEASSWLATRLNDNQTQNNLSSNNEVRLDNPQVTFQNGEAQLYGEIEIPGWGSTPVMIDLFYLLTPQGKVEVGVGEINLGGFGLPDSFLRDINTQLQADIDRELNNLNPNYQVSNLTLQNGQLSISGRVPPP
jgi:hypothetical protein